MVGGGLKGMRGVEKNGFFLGPLDCMVVEFYPNISLYHNVCDPHTFYI